MARLVAAHPILPGRGEDHLAWCSEIKERRTELAASRGRVGVERQLVWVHTSSDLAVVRLDGDDPVNAVGDLASSDDPFDQWYAEREREIHGGPLLAGSDPPTCLTEYADGEPDELDMFLAVAVPLLPGQTESFRSSVEASAGSGDGLARLRLWRMRRLTIWLQRVRDQDIVIYDAVGDLGELLDSIAASDDPLVKDERASIREWYGIDLTAENWPIPTAVLAWSSPDAAEG